MKKYILFFLLTVFFILTSCSPNDDEVAAASDQDWENVETEALAVEIMEVSKGKLIPYLERSGTLEGIHEVQVVSQTQGEILEMPVKLGSSLSEGDIILKVDDQLALLNLKSAEEQLKSAQLNYDALSSSVGQGGSSRRDLVSASSALAAAEAALERARQDYENCTIRSPINGYISRLGSNLSPGNRLSPGTLVASLVDKSAWSVMIYLGEREIGFLEEGSQVAVHVPAVGDKVDQGIIYAKAAGSDRSTGSYQVEITWTSDNPAILSGMTAHVQIPSNDRGDRMIIPSSAILMRNGRPFVYIEQEGTAEAVEVSVSDSLGNRTAIIQGLSEGDRLITSGLSQLRPGRTVIPTLTDPME